MCRCTLWIWCSRDTVSIATKFTVQACGERRWLVIRCTAAQRAGEPGPRSLARGRGGTALICPFQGPWLCMMQLHSAGPQGTVPKLPHWPSASWDWLSSCCAQAGGSWAAGAENAAARTLTSGWLVSILDLALGHVLSPSRIASGAGLLLQSPGGSCTRDDFGSRLTSRMLRSSNCSERSNT